MERELGELIGQMRMVLADLDDIKTELKALQVWRWKVTGMATVVGAAAGWLAGKL